MGIQIRAKARKYESNFDGPYQVQEVLGKGAYKLRDITGREKESTIRIN